MRENARMCGEIAAKMKERRVARLVTRPPHVNCHTNAQCFSLAKTRVARKIRARGCNAADARMFSHIRMQGRVPHS